MKYLMYFFIILFILFAAVQYNDSDALVWILVYLTPAYLCYYKLRNRGDSRLFFLIGLVFLLWAINIFPDQWEGLMLENLTMKTRNVELARESLGLGICTIASWTCAFIR